MATKEFVPASEEQRKQWVAESLAYSAEMAKRRKATRVANDAAQVAMRNGRGLTDSEKARIRQIGMAISVCDRAIGCIKCAQPVDLEVLSAIIRLAGLVV